MVLAVWQQMVLTTVWYVFRCCCDTRAGGGRGLGCLAGAGGLPGASMVAVRAVLFLRLFFMSGYSVMLFVRLRFGLLGAVCCFVSAAPLRVWCFVPLPAALGPASVLPLRVVGSRP